MRPRCESMYVPYSGITTAEFPPVLDCMRGSKQEGTSLFTLSFYLAIFASANHAHVNIRKTNDRSVALGLRNRGNRESEVAYVANQVPLTYLLLDVFLCNRKDRQVSSAVPLAVASTPVPR